MLCSVHQSATVDTQWEFVVAWWNRTKLILLAFAISALLTLSYVLIGYAAMRWLG